MNLLKLEKMHNQKKDLLNFYFQPVKTISQNQALRMNRKELGFLFLEEILASEDFKNLNNPKIVLIEKNKIKVLDLDINNPDDLAIKGIKSEIVIVIGKFELSPQGFSVSDTDNFYLEIPVDGYLYGEVNPFLIKEDKLNIQKRAA